MLRGSVLVLILVTLGTGCATMSSPVAKNFSGPTATLKDSIDLASGASCGSFYFLEEYDGKPVDNALSSSAEANAGNGMAMARTVDYARPIPVRDAAFHITGRTHCAAPIQELTRTMYVVDGVVHFTPEEGASYVVTGELASDHGAVWVRNEKTGTQVGNKLLINGEPRASKWNGAMTGKVTEVPSLP